MVMARLINVQKTALFVSDDVLKSHEVEVSVSRCDCL
jgi:hypothetical protein